MSIFGWSEPPPPPSPPPPSPTASLGEIAPLGIVLALALGLVLLKTCRGVVQWVKASIAVAIGVFVGQCAFAAVADAGGLPWAIEKLLNRAWWGAIEALQGRGWL